MHTIMKLSPFNLNTNDVSNWIKNNFEVNEFSLGNHLSNNKVNVTFFQKQLNYDMPGFRYDLINDHEVIMYDLEKSKEFEKAWDWWITEKWYAYDAHFADHNSMREWCCKNIKMSDWKIIGCLFTFKTLEDFKLFSDKFGEEYQDDFDVWSEE